MAKKDWTKLTTPQLLEEIEKEENDDFFLDILKEICDRSPFAGMEERINGLEATIDEQEKEIKKLKEIIRTHAHVDGKTMVEI